MYVPFIDHMLGRSYVEHAEMRVSFPYYIGPPTWTLFHTVAEHAESLQDVVLVRRETTVKKAAILSQETETRP